MHLLTTLFYLPFRVKISTSQFLNIQIYIFLKTTAKTKNSSNFRQSVKKFEKLKRDLDKAQADFSLLAKERNDAVSQLTKEMKEIERLEGERVELFSRIDSYERSKSDRKESTDVTKNMGDLNLKLKMEVGQVKFENEKLSKEREDVGNKLVSTKSTLRQTESDLKSCKSKLSEATESCTNLKNLLEATQIELKKAKDAEMSAKMEVTKAMKEAVSSSDGTSKVGIIDHRSTYLIQHFI